MARNTKLNDLHRAFIVRQLACYASPTQAVEALNQCFGVVISPQATERYHPHKKKGIRLAQKWVDLFDEARQDFHDFIEKHVPSANKAVRIQRLERASNAFENAKNYYGMANMLERIAKEMGNVHTNRREFTGKNQGPIKIEAVHDMTDEQIDTELERLWAKARGEEPKPTKH